LLKCEYFYQNLFWLHLIGRNFISLEGIGHGKYILLFVFYIIDKL